MTDLLKRLILKGVALELQEDRSREIHVTDLVYPCIRKAYYQKTMPPAYKGETSLLTLWIGKKLHETRPPNAYDFSDKTVEEAREILTPELVRDIESGTEPVVLHELPLEAELGGARVVGRTDMVVWDPESGEWIVVDKKTVEREAPRSPYSHHVEQVLFYASMLNSLYGITPTRGAVAYIQLSQGKTIEVHEFDILPDKLEEARGVMEERASGLALALGTGVLPEPVMGWYCRYCPYYEACVLDLNPRG